MRFLRYLSGYTTRLKLDVQTGETEMIGLYELASVFATLMCQVNGLSCSLLIEAVYGIKVIAVSWSLIMALTRIQFGPLR
jgi:hypothetical protein